VEMCRENFAANAEMTKRRWQRPDSGICTRKKLSLSFGSDGSEITRILSSLV